MEKSPRIEYWSPKESLEHGESAQHRFNLFIEGQKIGVAEVDYFSKPLPVYQITDLYIDPQEQGRGLASKIMSQIEQFLKEKKKPGILADAIMPGKPAYGMYERRGWNKIPNSGGLLVYNWPSDVNLNVLNGFPFRYTDLLKRPGYSNKE